MNLKEKLEYYRDSFDEGHLLPHPMDQLNDWFHKAYEVGIPYFNAATVATVDSNHRPHVRVVLIKEITQDGIQFFTNYESPKSQDIALNDQVEINIFWKEMDRQIRLSGRAQKCTREESEKYFATRAYDSQIGAHASPQGRPITKDELLLRIEKLKADFHDKEVPCPSHWGGYNIQVENFEFWQGRPNRLHDRFFYQKKNGAWTITRLGP